MVRVAFLVEGQTEEILINHLVSIGWFEQFNITVVVNVNVEGNGNFCSHNINKFIHQAKTFNPDKIVIFTDLECDPCIQSTKKRLGDCNSCITIVIRKAIESWFLADTSLMRRLTQNDAFYYEFPESTKCMPIDTIKEALKANAVRGTGPSKPRFINRVIKEGFDIESIVKHPNLQSIKYFIDKLSKVGEKI